MKNHIRLALYTLLFIATSCNEVKITTVPPSTRENFNSTESTSQPSLTSTPEIFSFQVDWYDSQLEKMFLSQDQLTDSQLEIRISEKNRKCYKPGAFTYLPDNKFNYTFGEQIEIEVTYKNLTDKTVRISNYDYLTSANRLKEYNAQLIPILSTKTKQHITTMDETQTTGYPIKPDDSGNFYDISLNSSIQTIVSYITPTLILYKDKSDEINSIIIPPGNYLLRFFYFSSGENETWQGVISSNQVEICISN